MSAAMGSAAKVMGQANAAMNPQQLQATMQQFSRQTAIMDMSEEMMDDALADAVSCAGHTVTHLTSSMMMSLRRTLWCPRFWMRLALISLAWCGPCFVLPLSPPQMADAPTARVGTRVAAAAPASAEPSDAEVAAMMRELGV